MAGLLHRLPHVNAVRVNHAARCVTLTFDPLHLTGPELVERLSYLGLTIVELSEPAGWGPMVAQRVAPRVANPATLAGQANLKLLAASVGRVDLVRMVAGLLILVAALDGRAAWLQGLPLPWARMLIYLSVAASLWARSQPLGEERVPGEAKRDHHSQARHRPRPGLRRPSAAPRVPRSAPASFSRAS